jgi:hypothetical protein
MKTQTKKPLTVHLAPAYRRALAKIAKRRDVSLGRLIREGIVHLIREDSRRGR